MQRIQTGMKPARDRKVTFYAKEPTRCPVCDASFRREELFSGRVSADEMTDELHRTYKPLHAFGEVNPKDDRAWQERPDPAGEDYRARLGRLAGETNSAFLDMSAAWGRYVRESGKELDWFKRDPIHANERGEQILGRILDQYFTLPDAQSAPAATKPAVD